jgi:hypothetical protein
MAKALRIVGTIAAVVALTFAIPGFGTAIGLTAATAATVSTVAAVVSTVAMAAAAAMQKPPGMKGTTHQVMIGNNMPVPYAMGRTFIGGSKVYDNSSGPKNKFRTHIVVYTAAGPIKSYEKMVVDFKNITSFTAQVGTAPEYSQLKGKAAGYYDDFFWLDTRLGTRPDTALVAHTSLPDFYLWGADHKLSGYACAALTMKFDKDGKRYSGGIPLFGMVGRWVKIYDPRLDSTYPGGSGAQRWDDEATWEWSENPALHALTYLRGRFMNGIKVVGVGLPQEAIDIPAFVELANVCDTNDWKVGGVVYEGPDISKWDNLKQILHAAAAKPAWMGGMLSLSTSTPKVSLDTVTIDDVIDSIQIQAMKSWRDRINTVVPRFKSELHNWDYVQSTAVSLESYVTEDGETKTLEVPFTLVQEKDQAAQLAAYELTNRREFGPITLTVKPRLMIYRVGEALTLDIPEAGLMEQLAVITGRSIDPATGAVRLTLESETNSKHAFALNQTGFLPETPVLYEPEDVDNVNAENNPNNHYMPEIPTQFIYHQWNGVPHSGQMPRTISAKRYSVGVDVTAESEWSFEVIDGDVTATIGADTGVLTITACKMDSAIRITSIYNDILVHRAFTIDRRLGQAPVNASTGGSTATDTTLLSISSTTMTPITDEITVISGSNGEVALSAPLSVTSTSAAPIEASLPVYGRWQWWNGVDWTDLGVEATSSPHCSVTVISYSGATFYYPLPGALSVSATKTGLVAGNTHRFRLVARADSTRTMHFTGTASAVAS